MSSRRGAADMNPLFNEPVLIVVQQYEAFDTAANYTV